MRGSKSLKRFSPYLLLCFLCLLGLLAAAQPPADVVRFAVIGDSGTGDSYQYRIGEQMLAWHDRYPFDLVLMLGDNIYGGLLGMGGGNEKDFAEKFDNPYAPLRARGVVFRATLGNHDMRNDEGRDLINARDRFHIDGPLGYYNFTAGAWQPSDGLPAPLLEFFVINTVRLEKNKRDPDQLAWLERTLAASRARWRIVYGHHPLYSTGYRHGSDLHLRQKLEPLLGGPDPAAPRAQVVLAGHDHIYERFHPQKGVVYFVCGSSGQLRRGNAGASPLVEAKQDQQRTFMLWEATPEELRFRAINEQGQAFDCGVLRAGAATPEPAACLP